MSTETKQEEQIDIMGMFRALLQENREASLAMVAEMKKPSAEEQAKIDGDKNRALELSKRRVEAARRMERDVKASQENCSHLMPNGQTNLRGQVMSNGFAQVMCSHCRYVSAPFEATDVERNQSGLNIDKWGPSAFAVVQRRIKSSSTLPPPVPDIPAGATIIFG